MDERGHSDAEIALWLGHYLTKVTSFAPPGALFKAGDEWGEYFLLCQTKIELSTENSPDQSRTPTTPSVLRRSAIELAAADFDPFLS